MSNAVETKVKKERPGLKLGTKSATVAPAKKQDALIIGGAPRVSLLPPEVHGRKNARRLRRRLGLGLIGAVVLVVAGVGLATVSLLASQASLTKAQSDASALGVQQAKYGAVTKIQVDSQGIKTAQITATSQEIEWTPYVADIQKTLTPGMQISSVDASLDDANAGTASVPLQGPRIATLKLAVTSPQSSIADWLISLQSLKGFVDATPGSVTLAGTSYKVEVVIHVNDQALANRFAEK